MQKELKKENDEESKKELKKVEEKLVKLKSNDLFKVVKDEIEKIDCESGLWRLQFRTSLENQK